MVRTQRPQYRCPGSQSRASRFSAPIARCVLVVLSVGLSGTAWSCGGQSCERYFQLEEVREVRLPDGAYLREASGLTRAGDMLWTITDHSDAAIFRLELSSQEGVATARTVPLDIPPATQQALSQCGGRRRGRLDLEGIAAVTGGLFFLLSENYRAVLITRVEDPQGPNPRAIAQEVLCVPGKNQSTNDGLEGLSTYSGGILVLEEGRGWPTKRLYRCDLPGRQCTPLTSPVMNGRTPDLTLLDAHSTRLLVLNTFWGWSGNKICEMHMGDPTPKACLLDLDRVKESAKVRTDLPKSFRQDGGTNYEGIHFDPATGRLYLINDNNATWNRTFSGDAEREPTLLLIFTREQRSSHTPERDRRASGRENRGPRRIGR